MKLEIWRSKAAKSKGQWHWHVLASNGKKLAWSGEGYKRHGALIKVVKQLFPQAFDVEAKSMRVVHIV